MVEDNLTTFESFFERYHPMLLRYAVRRLPCRSIAEDITADVFHAAWERWSSNKTVELPWLYGVASNKITDQYRSAERRAAMETALARLAEEPGEQLDGFDMLALREAILALEDRDRVAITLSYWEGFSAKEIAQTLGCSTSAAWAIISRTRKRLRRLLDDSCCRYPLSLKKCCDDC